MTSEPTIGRTRKVTILAVMMITLLLLTIVYAFGASPYAGTFGTLQAQGNNGAITGLTLTSDAPGTLTVSWDTTSPVPTDHRVDWAKTGEDYQSWKVDDGHKYPAPTDTTATIADLEHDTEYKIRMRARYYRGEHEGKSWGGPWAEGTLQVAGTPETPSNTVTRDSDPPEPTLPAAPSFINTAVTEDQVLLSWLNPSDDSITGYQILRGPDAANLVVIEDDTGSSSTSYTDTAPPAGQTHTYGVKARNSAGLSPAGTATATVPAEEVLITARHGSTGNTLVSNTGQTPSSGGALAGVFVGQETRQAMQFTTGDNPFGYHVTSAQLSLKKDSGPDIPTPQVSIRNVNLGGFPGSTVLYTFTTSSILTSSYQLITFTTTDETKLVPNTSYFLHVAIEGASAIQIQLTASDNEDAESKAIWQIGNARHYNTDGGPWSTDTSSNLQMQISGHQAPDNRPYLVTNLSNERGTPLFIGRQVIKITALAQSFRAADATSGYPYRFNFHGIKVQAYSTDGQPSLDDLQFGLYTRRQWTRRRTVVHADPTAGVKGVDKTYQWGGAEVYYQRGHWPA